MSESDGIGTKAGYMFRLPVVVQKAVGEEYVIFPADLRAEKALVILCDAMQAAFGSAVGGATITDRMLFVDLEGVRNTICSSFCALTSPGARGASSDFQDHGTSSGFVNSEEKRVWFWFWRDGEDVGV